MGVGRSRAPLALPFQVFRGRGVLLLFCAAPSWLALARTGRRDAGTWRMRVDRGYHPGYI
jgi:hypothetical protein